MVDFNTVLNVRVQAYFKQKYCTQKPYNIVKKIFM
jgi:hypothetical protein